MPILDMWEDNKYAGRAFVKTSASWDFIEMCVVFKILFLNFFTDKVTIQLNVLGPFMEYGVQSNVHRNFVITLQHNNMRMRVMTR